MNNPLEATLRELKTCGCCAGTTAQTPEAIHNRPGLPEIAFRAGVHSSFKASLLAGLSAASHPALRNLRTRADGDFTIGLLDAFAGMADVLTFYSERIANEAFLRTATERRSILELARAIGYELSPGLAAHVLLAFTIEGGRGAPGTAIIPKGTKVQSVPGPEEKPQVFETTTEFRGLAQWNELRPRLREGPLDGQALLALAPGGPLFLAGTNTNLRKGDVLVLSHGLTKRAVARRVAAVTVDRDWNHTQVEFETSAEGAHTPATGSTAVTIVDRIDLTARVAPTKEHIHELFLEAGLSSDAYQSLPYVFIGGTEPIRIHLNTRPRIAPTTARTGVFAMRERVGFFGHNAPRHATLSKELKGSFSDWDATPTTIWQDSGGVDLFKSPDFEFDVLLERPVPETRRDGWAVFEAHTGELTVFQITNSAEVSRADYAMSARCTALQLQPLPATTPLQRDVTFKTRTTTAHIRSEALDVIGAPKVDPLAAGERKIELDVIEDQLQAGRWLLLEGEDAGLPRTYHREFVQIVDLHHRDVTTLILHRGLTRSYVRSTVTLNANVVPATHGETVNEVLGSGDASQAHQRFTLKQKPLTYTLPDNGGLPASSLEVWVDEVRWREVPYLYGAKPADRVYVVRRADDGTTSIQFGDGQRGARLPTGHENVRAVYRKGTGLEGQVKAGQLNLLLTQPLGVKSVTNPLPPAGAENPQALALARQNAPRTVLTLDRVVSLQDYEDYARDFPGVDKAHAVWTWSENTRGVLLTLLGPEGLEITESSPTAEALVVALHRLGNPHLPIRIVTARPTLFTLYGSVRTTADRSRTQVDAAVRAALREKFSYEARDFGQGVAFSEVIAAIQGVPGVDSADLDRIKKRTFGPEGVIPENFLGGYVPSHLPRDGGSLQSARPAELLLLDERTFGSPTFTIV
jgi:predicted phage baseplate assembly protein